MDREVIKKTLVEGFENKRHSSFDLDDTYRIYCYIEDSNGFWDTYIHMAIDNNITKKIDLLEDDCDMCDQVMFEEKIDKLLDRYEKELKNQMKNQDFIQKGFEE